MGFEYQFDPGIEGELKEEYMKMLKPALFGKYRCSYCGKLLDSKHTYINYIYPKDKMESNKRIKKRALRAGITNPDSMENMVHSCYHCMHLRSDALGLWLLRAKIGKNERNWRLLFLAIAILVVVFVIPKIIYPILTGISNVMNIPVYASTIFVLLLISWIIFFNWLRTVSYTFDAVCEVMEFILEAIIKILPLVGAMLILLII